MLKSTFLGTDVYNNTVSTKWTQKSMTLSFHRVWTMV